MKDGTTSRRAVWISYSLQLSVYAAAFLTHTGRSFFMIVR